MFQRTTAINKILALKHRKKIIQGGTWAGKTYGIIPVLIDYSIKNKNKTVTIVAETIPAIKGGALKDFKNVMRDTGRWNESNFNASDLHYTFGSGTKIEFKSFDSVGKAQAAGKRDVLFINEAPYIPYDIADALIGRTTEDIYIDFNPDPLHTCPHLIDDSAIQPLHAFLALPTHSVCRAKKGCASKK